MIDFARRSMTLLLLCLSLSPVLVAQAGEPGILVLGGTRGVGLETVRLLRARGEAVSVLVRPASDVDALRAAGATLVIGDALERGSVDAALAGGSFRAVISTLSGKADDGRTADAEGNINAIEAAEAAGVKRFILVTSIGVGDSEEAMPWIARKVLGSFLEAKGRAEESLFVSSLDYTVVRPGNLKDGEPTGTAILTEDRTVVSRIQRADVARLVVDCLDRPETIGKIYAAVEPD